VLININWIISAKSKDKEINIVYSSFFQKLLILQKFSLSDGRFLKEIIVAFGPYTTVLASQI